MTAFGYDTLWNKSRIFVDRALKARDDSLSLEFYIWAATAVELLGKALLAHTHPSLVADPSHFPSLLAACRPESPPVGLRSITAKTLFERLHSIVPGFDEPMKRGALLMAERRNAELHSGDAPTQGLDPRIWVPAFWKTARTLIEAQQRTLEEWLGPEEATRVSAIIADATELGRQAVAARIARRKREYDGQFQPGSSEREEALNRATGRPLPARFTSIGDEREEVQCPACGTKAWLFGYEVDEEVVGSEDGDDNGYGYTEIVQKTYSVEEFRCPQCGLVLEGIDEVASASLEPEFIREDYREPDYEPDYGNE